MKYNDLMTVRVCANHQDKQDRSEEWRSDRHRKREYDRGYKKFINKLYKYLEHDWWDSVDSHTKKILYNEWSHIASMATSTGNQYNFDEWIKRVKRDIKPNIQIYRNKKLNKILKGAC